MSRWKFWQKPAEPTAPPEDDVVKANEFEQASVNVFDLKVVEGRRFILDWRDRYEYEIDARLKGDLDHLEREIRAQFEGPSLSDLMRKQRQLLDQQVAPVISAWVNAQWTQILDAAARDLNAELLRHGRQFKSDHPLAEDATAKRALDFARALGPLAAGGLAIPAVLAASTASGGFLALLGTSVVAWPVAITGVAVIGGLFALGGYNLTHMKERIVDRCVASTMAHLHEVVFGQDLSNPSLSSSLQEVIRETAREQIRSLVSV